ncbi:MAG: HAD family hydrolase [candidate division KSB1 bacterium]|nr:HAD family hydrolase [candidate division KSB1 bacterium]
MIKWIFFDIGNVILNDDPAMAFFYHEIFQAIQQNGQTVSLEEVLAVRERSILVERNGRHYEVVMRRFLGDGVWQKVDRRIRRALSDNWAQHSPIIPGIGPVIQKLAENYQLGIIANQPREVIGVLDQLGLLGYFRIHGISQIVGMVKPDVNFFRWALAQANCPAPEAIMIGDRVDNDIKPAKAIGMKTIWLSLPLEKKGYEPREDFERRYFESLRRASASRMPPLDASDTPDAFAQDFETLLDQIYWLNNSVHAPKQEF